MARQVISHSFMQWIISLYSRWALQTFTPHHRIDRPKRLSPKCCNRLPDRRQLIRHSPADYASSSFRQSTFGSMLFRRVCGIRYVFKLISNVDDLCYRLCLQSNRGMNTRRYYCSAHRIVFMTIHHRRFDHYFIEVSRSRLVFRVIPNDSYTLSKYYWKRHALNLVSGYWLPYLFQLNVMDSIL